MVKREPLEKGTMWSYSKQRQPWQLQKRLQTMLPAASLRHLSGWRPGTVSAFAQHMLLAFPSKYLGLSSLLLLLLLLRERFGDEEEEEELILVLFRLYCLFNKVGNYIKRQLIYLLIFLSRPGLNLAITVVIRLLFLCQKRLWHSPVPTCRQAFMTSKTLDALS